MKILRWLDAHFEEVLLAILLIVIACVSLLQVVIGKVRFIPALTWAEEFCRFCWVTSRRSIMARTMVMPDTTRIVVDWSLFMLALTTSVGTIPRTIHSWKFAGS